MRAFGMLIVLMLLFQPAAGPVFAKKLITNRANVFGNADNRAFVYISRPLPKIDFGDSSIIFNMEFSSNPKKTPGNLGMYWSVSLFDSVAVKTDPAQLEWKTPNRMSYFFRKGKSPNTGYEFFSFNNGEFTAKLDKKGRILIEHGKDKDCFYEYKDGRLSKFCAGKKSDTFVVNYFSDGRVKNLHNQSKKKTELEFFYDGAAKEASRMKIGGAVYKFGYTDIPGRADEDGKTGSAAKALSLVQTSDGSFEKMAYTAEKPRSRTVVSRDFARNDTASVKVSRMEVYDADGNSKGYVEWCAETGMIMADNAGRYNTGNDVSDPLNPGYVGGARPVPGLSVVEYFQSGKQYPERYYYDWKNAILITTTGATGNTVKKSLIGSKGPNYLKTRKIEILNGDSVGPGSSWRLDKIYNYDDKGRFMRELDANGRVAAYAVADDINYCIYRDGKLVFEEVAGKGVVEKNYYMDSGTRMCRKFFDSGDSEYFTYGKDGTLCYYEYRDAGERVLKKMFEYGFITEDVSENEKRITDVSGKLVAIVKKGADGSFRIQNKVNN